MSTDAPYFGIDFGTTNSSMAWYNPDIGRAETIRNDEGEDETPSLVYYDEGEKVLVGESAVQQLEDAEDSGDPDEREEVSQRIVKGIKRNLLVPPVIPLPDGRSVKPMDVVAEILKKLKHDVEGGHFHKAVERAVVTHPAVFGNQERNVLLEASANAGFGRVELLDEPTAAAMAFAELGQGVGRCVLVYDLGAGTFDLSVVVRDEDGSFRVAVEPQGDPHCGGNDFDLALYRHCDELAKEQLGRPINPKGDIDLAFLAQCRKRKENLSSREVSRFSSYLPSEDGPVRFKYEVSREDFEGLIGERVDQTVRKTAAMIERAKGLGHEVDTVVLIGGSSRIPLVRRRLQETLPIEPLGFSEKDYAVALGAAYRAHEVWKTAPKPEPKLEEYKRALKVCWQDMKLTQTEAEWLENLARQELGLSPEAAASVEREIMGDAMEAVLESQEQEAKKRYRRIVELVFENEKIKALGSMPSARLGMLLENRDLFLGFDFQDCPVSAEEREELLGELPWSVFAVAARLGTDENLDVTEIRERLRTLANELGLGEERAVAIECEILDGTIETSLQRRGSASDDIENINLSQTLTRHSDSITSVAFSPDGRTIASSSFDETIRLWDAQTGELLRILAGRSGIVSSVAFGQNGLIIASGNEDAAIELWDTQTGGMTQTMVGHGGWVVSVAFSPDNRTIASGNLDGTIELWDAQTGVTIQTLVGGHDYQVASVVFSPDGRTISSSSTEDGTIRLWHAQTGELLQTLTGHSSGVISVAFSPNGELLASGSLDETIRLWDAQTGGLLQALTGHSGGVNSVAFSPDGRVLASGSNDKTIQLWDAQTGEPLRTLTGHSHLVGSVAFSPDGRTIVSGSGDSTIKIWSRTQSDQTVDSGNVVMTAKQDVEERSQKPPDKLLYTLTGHTGRLWCLAFSPDGQLLASGGYDNTIRLWDARTGELLQTLTGHTSAVRSVAFSPDDQLLASGSDDNTIKLWEVRTGELLRTLTGHADGVISIAFSPDGQTIISSDDGHFQTRPWVVRLWDTRTGELLATLDAGHTDSVESVAFSPDAQIIASSGEDDTVKLWDARTGKPLRVLEDGGLAYSIAFSHDGETIAGNCNDNTFRLWDVRAGKLLRTLDQPEADRWGNPIAFSPDGQLLANGGLDGTIGIYDMRTGELLYISGHTDEIWSVVFSPDGQFLASGSDDKTIKIWGRTSSDRKDEANLPTQRRNKKPSQAAKRTSEDKVWNYNGLMDTFSL